MTVSDPGAGQQQGREAVCRCGLPRSSPVHGNPFVRGHDWDPAPSPTPPARDSGRAGCTCDAPLSSCAPGCPCTSCDALRDSGRDEAREAVARWLAANTAHKDGDVWPRSGTLLGAADELLSLPELALVEHQCPACGATTRARMADQ